MQAILGLLSNHFSKHFHATHSFTQVTGSEDATARMWTAAEAETECIGVFRGHTGYVNAVAIVEYSIYDRRDEDSINVCAVLTGSADATIRKWDATSCECLFVYEGHTARIQK